VTAKKMTTTMRTTATRNERARHLFQGGEGISEPKCFLLGGGQATLGSTSCWTGTERVFDHPLWPTGASNHYNNAVTVSIPGSGPPAAVTRKPTTTYGKPVLDERTFQQLLAAACTLQDHNDRLMMKEHKADCAALSPRGIVKNLLSIQAVPLTFGPLAVPHSDRLLGTVLRPAQAEVEPVAPQYDSVIPPETAYRLSVLASQLEALMQREIRTDSEWTTPQAPAAAQGTQVSAQQTAVHSTEVQGQSVLEQPRSELARLIPLVQPAVPSGTSIVPDRTARRPISPSNESFWRTATVVALAAVLSLLLGASVHRLSPLPGRLSQPSEVVQQQVPLQRTKPVGTVLASDRKPIVMPNRPDSTYGSEADIVAEDTVVRHHARGASLGVQAQKKP